MTASAVAVRERPIPFSAEMVKAILDDRKTQTRRVVALPPWLVRAGASLDSAWADPGLGGGGYLKVTNPVDDTVHRVRCAYGAIGDRLWVRETWEVHKALDGFAGSEIPENQRAVGHYSADAIKVGESLERRLGRKRASRFMPRWASRITLEITDVRVERLTAISEADAIAEGCFDEKEHDGELPSRIYRQLWDSLNASRGYSWESNPWVWCLSFRRVTP